MRAKLFNGICSKVKYNFTLSSSILNTIENNKSKLSTDNILISCFKSSAQSQRNFLTYSPITVSSHISKLSSFNHNKTPKIVNLVSHNRYLCTKNDKFDSIPGLGIKATPQKEIPNEKPNENDKKEEKDTWYNGKNAWKVGLACLGISGLAAFSGFVFTFGGPQIDPDGNKVVDEFTGMNPIFGYLKRATREMKSMKKMIQDPSSEKLLPDVLKEPWYQPPYTLVIEMTGILVHPDWTLSTGWRFKKRPGLAYFLQNVGPPLFEIVIYTHEQGFTAYPIIDSMDPEGRVMYRLFRDATKYVNGAHVKDLSFLNRDLSKVIMVDCDPKAMSLQPRNGLLIKKWSGEDSDRKLIDLANFLKTVALSEVDDVRGVMEYYSQFDDPLAVFKERTKQLQQLEEEKEKAALASKSKSMLRSAFNKKF